jgi:uncharacterized protein
MTLRMAFAVALSAMRQARLEKGATVKKGRLVPLIVLTFVVCIADARAVPPPIAQTSADCLNASYATDVFVCADADLLAVDREVAALWRRTSETWRLHSGDLIESQEDWFRRRSRCAFQSPQKPCVAAAYHERIVVLRLLSAPPELAPGGRFRCTGAPWHDVVAHGSEGQSFVVRKRGRILAVGLPESAAWTPFLRVNRAGGVVRLTTYDQSINAVCRAL